MTRQRKPISRVPTTIEEGKPLDFARAWLTHARHMWAFGVRDPFDDDAMRTDVRRSFKTLAGWHPRNAARVLQFALAGVEEADQALKDLISETNARHEPLGPALPTYVDILANQGPPEYRHPKGRQRGNYIANFVICVLMLSYESTSACRGRRAPAAARRSARWWRRR